MDLCRTVAAACERSAASVVEGFGDSAGGDRDDKPPASRSAWRYCSPRSFADFAGRRVSLPAEVLENCLRKQIPHSLVRKVAISLSLSLSLSLSSYIFLLDTFYSMSNRGRKSANSISFVINS